MDEGIAFDANGIAVAVRDERWAAEAARETLRAIVDVERQALLPNVLSWIVVALAALLLPNAASFFIPLVLRLAAMAAARTAFRHLRDRIAAGGDLRPAVRVVAASLVLAGASCAPVLAPILLDPFIHPARMIVGGVVMVGVTIVFSLLAPIRRLAFSYIAGFVGTFAAIMLIAKGAAALVTIVALGGILAIVAIYGTVSARHHRRAAETLIENQRLGEELADSLRHAEFLAYRDPLTGLHNRRAFFQHADCGDRSRLRHVLIIDLDRFKTVNDRFGHAVGDRVLVGVGATLLASIGEIPGGRHFGARIGGEEFAVSLAVEDAELASFAAEALRHRIALIAGDLAIPGLVTTASIGLAAWHPGEALDDVLSQADAALYEAKAAGRDQIAKVRLVAR